MSPDPLHAALREIVMPSRLAIPPGLSTKTLSTTTVNVPHAPARMLIKRATRSAGGGSRKRHRTGNCWRDFD